MIFGNPPYFIIFAVNRGLMSRRLFKHIIVETNIFYLIKLRETSGIMHLSNKVSNSLTRGTIQGSSTIESLARDSSDVKLYNADKTSISSGLFNNSIVDSNCLFSII